MKLNEILIRLQVGDLIEFSDGEVMLIGHATLSRQPTDNDGGIGWSEYLDKEVVKLRHVDLYTPLRLEWYENTARFTEGKNVVTE